LIVTSTKCIISVWNHNVEYHKNIQSICLLNTSECEQENNLNVHPQMDKEFVICAYIYICMCACMYTYAYDEILFSFALGDHAFVTRWIILKD
jgi:hypothetical protein